MQSENNEDSFQLQIQMPKEKKNKVAAVISSWEFSIEDCNPLEFKLFLVVSQVYFRNLIDKKEDPKLNQSQRKRLGHNCLIVQDFQIDFITQDGQHRNKDPYRGEISLTTLQYRGLEVALRLGELELSSQDLIQARIIFQNNDEVDYKIFNLTKVDGDSENTYKCFIDESFFSLYFKQHIAVEFLVRKQYIRDRRFRGIQNQGSTCYMNSTLQILFFLRPLRKIVLQYNGKNQVLNVLKRIFIQMIDVNSQSLPNRTIDASDLITAYGRFPQPRRQQDIHQFLLGFLDELEGQCPELKQLWIGSGKQILSSKQPQKPYTNNISEDFNEIDLLLQDHRGNTLGGMSDSLNLLLQEEQVDDKIETDEFGKIQVAKRREFINLPYVIFFNLKRYRYKKQRNRPLKILTDFAYPSSIKLGFLQRTPTGQDEDYVLFGLAVHKGQTYNSGHYYSFVNTSVHLNTSNWVKFNDSSVSISSEETALSFTGGKRKNLSWNKQYHKFTENQSISQETAYLLVYIRRDKFRDFQNIPTMIPRDWILKRRAQSEKDSNSPTQQIEVCILQQNQSQFQPFEDIPSFNITLKQNQQIQGQLVKMVNAMGCKIGTIWKVNRQKKKMKQLINYVDLPQTPARVFGFKRGHTVPDYLLLIPQSHKIYQEGFQMQEKHTKIGIICTAVKRENNFEKFYRIINKNCLDQYLTDQEKRLEKKGYVQNKEQFLYDWNDFCTIIFE